MEADYSWLALSSPSHERRVYEIPEMKRIELEQLCSRLHPSDCGTVILSFRRAVDDQQPTSAELIPAILRSVVCTVTYTLFPLVTASRRQKTCLFRKFFSP